MNRFSRPMIAMVLVVDLASLPLGAIGNGHEARGIMPFAIAPCPVPHAASNFGSQALAEALGSVRGTPSFVEVSEKTAMVAHQISEVPPAQAAEPRTLVDLYSILSMLHPTFVIRVGASVILSRQSISTDPNFQANAAYVLGRLAAVGITEERFVQALIAVERFKRRIQFQDRLNNLKPPSDLDYTFPIIINPKSGDLEIDLANTAFISMLKSLHAEDVLTGAVGHEYGHWAVENNLVTSASRDAGAAPSFLFADVLAEAAQVEILSDAFTRSLMGECGYNYYLLWSLRAMRRVRELALREGIQSTDPMIDLNQFTYMLVLAESLPDSLERNEMATWLKEQCGDSVAEVVFKGNDLSVQKWKEVLAFYAEIQATSRLNETIVISAGPAERVVSEDGDVRPMAPLRGVQLGIRYISKGVDPRYDCLLTLKNFVEGRLAVDAFGSWAQDLGFYIESAVYKLQEFSQDIRAEDPDLSTYISDLLTKLPQNQRPIDIRVSNTLHLTAARYPPSCTMRPKIYLSAGFVWTLGELRKAGLMELAIWLLAERLFHELGHSNHWLGPAEREEEEDRVEWDFRLHEAIRKTALGRQLRRMFSIHRQIISFSSGYYFRFLESLIRLTAAERKIRIFEYVQKSLPDKLFRSAALVKGMGAASDSMEPTGPAITPTDILDAPWSDMETAKRATLFGRESLKRIRAITKFAPGLLLYIVVDPPSIEALMRLACELQGEHRELILQSLEDLENAARSSHEILDNYSLKADRFMPVSHLDPRALALNALYNEMPVNALRAYFSKFKVVLERMDREGLKSLVTALRTIQEQFQDLVFWDLKGRYGVTRDPLILFHGTSGAHQMDRELDLLVVENTYVANDWWYTSIGTQYKLEVPFDRVKSSYHVVNAVLSAFHLDTNPEPQFILSGGPLRKFVPEALRRPA